MKKLLSILLILALSLSLVFAMSACKDEDDNSQNNNDNTPTDTCEHRYVDGICAECGKAEPAFPGDGDTYYDPEGWTKPEK